MTEYRCQNGDVFREEDQVEIILFGKSHLACPACLVRLLMNAEYTMMKKPSFEMKVDTFYKCRNGWKAGCFWQGLDGSFKILADDNGRHTNFCVDENGICTLKNVKEYDIVDYWEQ